MDIFSSTSPLSCNVLTNMYGRSRGFAIMKFKNSIDMNAAIEQFHRFELCSRKLDVISFPNISKASAQLLFITRFE